MPDNSYAENGRALATELRTAIDEWCTTNIEEDEHRNHLGGSVIAKECPRVPWYNFRWVKLVRFDGRMKRLFNRGHLEEQRIIAWLKGAGFEVWAVDTDGKQFRVSAAEGHYGGSLDLLLRHPYYTQGEMILGECKTHNLKSFTALVTKGVAKSKPEHWGQMNTYGRLRGITRALYFAVCKDNDDIHLEFLDLHPGYGDELTRKAEDTILRQRPPARAAMTKAHFICRFCDYSDVCHDGVAFEPNCRSCVFARPARNGEWWCEFHNDTIPKGYLIKGCPQWRTLPNE